jgi:hypothetical protein
MSRREQRALTLSMYGVALVAAGSIAYGLYLASDVVILNGIFSLLSLVGGGSTRDCCATTPRSGWWTSGSASKTTRCGVSGVACLAGRGYRKCR